MKEYKIFFDTLGMFRWLLKRAGKREVGLYFSFFVSYFCRKSENRCAAIDFPVCGNCFRLLCLSFYASSLHTRIYVKKSIRILQTCCFTDY